MLEKLYTRKVVIALMALILAANGLLLYQFRILPPTQTADTPSSEGSPQAPDDPRQEENVEETEESEDANGDPADDENGGENENAGETDGQEPDGSDSGEPQRDSGGLTPAEDAPEGEASPEIPFESQYGSPPTVAGSEGGSGDGGSSRIQIALASFYDPENDGDGSEGGANSSGEISILPTTSGFTFFPAIMLVGGAVIGAFAVARLRRR